MFRKKNNDISLRTILLVGTGIVFGFLIINQSRYFQTYVSSVGRDNNENIFRQIRILKTSTDDLRNEVKRLEEQLESISTHAQALETINDEIDKNKIIAGETDVFGPGIKIETNNDITDIWFTDIANALFANGAEAVSVNNIRLTDKTMGFDTLPNSQIMLNNVILKTPYVFAAIGDKNTLAEAFEIPGGIMDRMKNSIENFDYTINRPDRIEMKKV